MESNIRLNEHSVEFNNNCEPEARDTNKTWDINEFEQNLSIKIVQYSDDKNELEFDIIGVAAPIANAIRRVLLAEVPSMAIERVHMYNNTSIISDEVLAHRIGLIPLKADPRKFEFKTLVPCLSPDNPGIDEGEGNRWRENDSLQYRLKVKCSFAPKVKPSTGMKKESSGPSEQINSSVTSSNIEWIPIGKQVKKFMKEQVGPIHDDILIAKLRPGHEIDMIMYAVKGIGKDHAKFQPVSTATYRLMPDIRLLEEIEGERALRLQKCFSKGVIDLVTDDETKKTVAKVVNPRLDYCSRNVYRYDDLKDSVELGRVSDHYIFTIESVGALQSHELFLEAIKVLKEKCQRVLLTLDDDSTASTDGEENENQNPTTSTDVEETGNQESTTSTHVEENENQRSTK